VGQRKRLTVSSLWDPRECSGEDAMRWHSAPVKPYIRMRGQWLRRLGFEIGTRIEVEAEPGRLVLRAVSPSSAALDLSGYDLSAEVAESSSGEE
jgi:hypothetical protein